MTLYLKRNLITRGIAIFILFISNPSLSAELGLSSEPEQKRNVILIIGDGMDDHQITIARNYLKGAQGQLMLDKMPLRSSVQVLTVDEQQPELPVYVADSANSATAMATGEITSRGRIATTASSDMDIETIVEQAQAAGYGTGIVSSASVTDATPASFIAHVAVRRCENPDIMQYEEHFPRGLLAEHCAMDLVINGGLGSVAQQIALGNTDVVLGGGLQHFEPVAEGDSGKTLLQLAIENDYSVAKSIEQLESAPNNGKLLGLFSASTLPTLLQGEGGRVAEKPSPSLLNWLDWRLGSVTMPETMVCEANPDFEGIPPLKQMTDKALSILSVRSEQSTKGFFLMVESASIDKQSHARNPCGSIGEVQQLEEVLDSALAFAKENPNTLILVTADHGQAAQLVPVRSLFEGLGMPIYTPGYVALIETPEKQTMAVNYATNDFFYEEHTGVNVPLYSNEQGHGRVASNITQPQIYQIMHRYLFE